MRVISRGGGDLSSPSLLPLLSPSFFLSCTRASARVNGEKIFSLLFLTLFVSSTCAHIRDRRRRFFSSNSLLSRTCAYVFIRGSGRDPFFFPSLPLFSLFLLRFRPHRFSLFSLLRLPSYSRSLSRLPLMLTVVLICTHGHRKRHQRAKGH